ncbi:Co2+/Mg2+ efflux protein ApaG [Vibrio palustris]|uniref:Protein ApaG n=1 Tax=Vibrio palustris TaxID=1918946 RepID=A0A1R4B7P9_9VIBR|nr:Co2+/Mg2+ efflux protein ApaG [Vibrio palustris]SJL84926.1 CO2+/MG2+ efflux protein ApaG [Vibrio palustris]
MNHQTGIQIHVQTKYISEQSTPEKNHYIFAYLITVKNLTQHSVQLMSRRWLITDANGKQITVEGDGVVGEQPVIDSQQEYTYTSGTSIETPVGVMQGHYVMNDHEGNEFMADIAPFRLAMPNVLH